MLLHFIARHITTFLCLFTFLVFILSMYMFTIDLEINRCSMTYMFEMPQFHTIQLPKEIRKTFKHYSLTYYSEGNRILPNKFNGIPVLFIPGNAGSHKQVRSMGSIALRKSEDIGNKYIFDYFAVDFNEELGALHGRYLHNQTKFTAICVEQILSLYTHTSYGLVVIGHSMGGVVARNLFLLPEFNAYTIHTIITLATPHLAPVVGVDRVMVDLYANMNEYWLTNQKTTLRHVTLISLVGGSRDIQVWDGLGDASLIFDPERTLWMSTTAVNQAWVSTDHLCIIWCKEVCLSLSRALFDAIDKNTNQISLDPQQRMLTFRRHLIPRSPTFRLLEDTEKSLDVSKEAQSKTVKWHYLTHQTQVSFTATSLRTITFVKFGPITKNSNKSVFVTGTTIVHNWLFICDRNSVQNQTFGEKDPCISLVDISESGHFIPPPDRRRQQALLESDYVLRIGDYLVVKLIPTDKMVVVNFEEVDWSTRQLSVHSDPLGGRWHPVINETDPGALFYRISMPQLVHVTLPFRAKVKVLQCSKKPEDEHEGIIGFYSVWNSGYGHAIISSKVGQETELVLRLSQSRPASSDLEAHIDLLLSPVCRYSLNLFVSPLDVVTQVLRLNASILPAFVLIHLLLVIGHQVVRAIQGKDLESTVGYGLFFNMCSLPLMIGMCTIGYAGHIPNDWFRMSSLSLLELPSVFVLPLLGLSLVWAVFLLLHVIVWAGHIPLRLLIRWLGTDKFLLVGRILFILIGLLALVIDISLSKGVALVVLSLAFLQHCVWLYAGDGLSNRFRLHLSIAFLLGLIALFNISDTLAWIKQVQFLASRKRSLFSLPRSPGLSQSSDSPLTISPTFLIPGLTLLSLVCRGSPPPSLRTHFRPITRLPDFLLLGVMHLLASSLLLPCPTNFDYLHWVALGGLVAVAFISALSPKFLDIFGVKSNAVLPSLKKTN